MIRNAVFFMRPLYGQQPLLRQVNNWFGHKVYGPRGTPEVGVTSRRRSEPTRLNANRRNSISALVFSDFLTPPAKTTIPTLPAPSWKPHVQKARFRAVAHSRIVTTAHRINNPCRTCAVRIHALCKACAKQGSGAGDRKSTRLNS